MKWRVLKAKQECSFWSSTKCHERFLKIYYSVKYFIQKWMISHQRVIQCPITKDYIAVKFDDRNGEMKTVTTYKLVKSQLFFFLMVRFSPHLGILFSNQVELYLSFCDLNQTWYLSCRSLLDSNEYFE